MLTPMTSGPACSWGRTSICRFKNGPTCALLPPPPFNLLPIVSSRACHSSLLLGLHPDEAILSQFYLFLPTPILPNHVFQATEPIVAASCAFKRPFAVVPCCVFPRKFPHRYLVESTGELVPVVTYEQVSQPRHPSAAMLRTTTFFSFCVICRIW
jgi:hypothetical protein